MVEPIEAGTYQAQDANQQGLSQLERVADTYVSPEKTFLDIRRNASWWLPFLLGACVSLLFTYSVDRQIGFSKVAEANIDRSAQMEQRMSALPEAQRGQTMRTIATTTKVFSYGYPVISFLFSLIIAGILMVSFNFGLGAQQPYKQYLAVWFYASLPFAIKFALAAVAIFAGASSEQFDIQNPVGTNIGWYLSSDTPLWLRTLLTSADIFTIWTVVLLIVGCATVARVKRSSAAFIVVGWWVLAIVGFTAMAAFQG
ncbi:MAG: YIP1 family protein [Acidobacteriaceae bacterium]